MRSEGQQSEYKRRETHTSTWRREVEVSEDTKGRDCGRTGNPVQGGSDGLDVLSTTSILGGLQLFDNKVRTGRACAIDIHDDQRWNGDRERGG
jgi:hypothetical protein